MTATQTDREKLVDLIKDVRVAMITTHHDDELRSRPMATAKAEADGTLWFMTNADTEKVDEVREDRKVNVSYADAAHNLFVSVSGTVQVVRDLEKQKELWTPFAKAWFSGPEDPQLVLLKVTPQGAEYWDGPSNKVTQLFAMIKSAVTGSEDMGENRTLNVG